MSDEGASAYAELDEEMLRAMLGAATYQARRIARTLKLSPTEREDAEHEILLTLLARRRFFDPSRSPWPAFAYLVAGQAAQLVADNLVQSRSFSALSLSEMPQGSDPRDEQHLLLSDQSVPTELDILNVMSVLSFVRALPAELRLVAEAALMAEGDLAEAQRSTPLSSSEFYRRLGEIRVRMLMIGLISRRRTRPPGKKSDPPRYIESSGASEAARDRPESTVYPVVAERMTR